MQVRFLSNVSNRHGPTATPHKEGKPLAVERIVRMPLQLLLLQFMQRGQSIRRTSMSK